MSLISDEPLACLPFSPNWYLPQILSFSKQFTQTLVAFGVNNQIYIVDITTKTHVANLQIDFSDLRKGKIANEEKLHKITALKFHENFLFAGLNNGNVLIWSFSKASANNIEFTRYLICETNVQAINFIFVHNWHLGIVVVADSHGTTVLLSYKEKVLKNIEICILPEQKEMKIRNLFLIWNYYFLVFEEGRLQIWCPEKRKTMFETNFNKRIVDFQYILEEESGSNCRFLFLVKKNKKIELIYHRFGKEDLLRLGQNEKATEIEGEDTKSSAPQPKTSSTSFLTITNRIDLTFVLNNKLNKDKSIIKTWLCIKWLSSTQFIITGKIGEIYLLGIDIFATLTSLTFKPFSAEIGNQRPPYHLLNDNPHSKGIFGLFTHADEQGLETLVSLGLDRKIVFWSYDTEDIKDSISYEWRIGCLGGKVNGISYSELEKNIIFMSCEDSTIRFWSLNKKAEIYSSQNNSYFCQDASKGLQELHIRRIKSSNAKEGLLSLRGENSQIALYDLYTENVLKTTTRSDVPLLDFFFLPTPYAEVIKVFNADSNYSTYNDFKAGKFNLSSTKDQSLKLVGEKLVLFYSDLSYFIWPFEKDSLEERDFGKLEKLDLVENTEYTALALGTFKVNEQVILTEESEKYVAILIGDRKGFLHVHYIDSDRSRITLIKKMHKNTINSIKFNFFENIEDMLIALGSYDRKLTIIRMKPEHGNLTVEVVLRFKHKAPIMNVKWSTKNRILAVGLHNTTIQIWDCNVKPGEVDIPKFEPVQTKPSAKIVSGDLEEGEIECEDNIDEENSLEAVTENREVCNIRGHKGYITDAEFYLLDPNIVVSASDDQSVRLWNIDNIKNKKLANKKKKKK